MYRGAVTVIQTNTMKNSEKRESTAHTASSIHSRGIPANGVGRYSPSLKDKWSYLSTSLHKTQTIFPHPSLF